MKQSFICPKCFSEWSMTADKDGLFNGYVNPPCPKCGENGCDPNDYKDYTCSYCDHTWRQYGNGGLVRGRVPICPKCHT